jgi:hypothetical protein
MHVVDHAHGSGINELHVSACQFGKGRLRPALGVILEKLLVGQSIHPIEYLPPTITSDRETGIDISG